MNYCCVSACVSVQMHVRHLINYIRSTPNKLYCCVSKTSLLKQQLAQQVFRGSISPPLPIFAGVTSFTPRSLPSSLLLDDYFALRA
jgi:hypothetical protein